MILPIPTQVKLRPKATLWDRDKGIREEHTPGGPPGTQIGMAIVCDGRESNLIELWQEGTSLLQRGVPHWISRSPYKGESIFLPYVLRTLFGRSKRTSFSNG